MTVTCTAWRSSAEECVCVTALSCVVWCVCWPQYLACLKTSRSQTDKLSFDVGLQEDSTGKRKPSAQFCFYSSFTLAGSVSLCLSLFSSLCLCSSHFVSLSAVFKPALVISLSAPEQISARVLFSAPQLIFPVERCRHTAWFFCHRWLHLCCTFDSLVVLILIPGPISYLHYYLFPTMQQMSSHLNMT